MTPIFNTFGRATVERHPSKSDVTSFIEAVETPWHLCERPYGRGQNQFEGAK